MSLKLACPRCQHVQFFADESAGQPVSCAKCSQVFRVPRAVEPSPEPAAPTAAPWPWPGQMQARELPASFAPVEPAHAKVVPLPDEPPPRPKRAWDDDFGESEPREEKRR